MTNHSITPVCYGNVICRNRARKNIITSITYRYCGIFSSVITCAYGNRRKVSCTHGTGTVRRCINTLCIGMTADEKRKQRNKC